MTNTPNLDRAWLESKRQANEAYDARDTVSMVEHETRADLIAAQRTLAGYADRLARRLTALAGRLEAEAGDAGWINSLGEVQNSGGEIDLLCAQIATMRKTLEGLNSARKAAQR